MPLPSTSAPDLIPISRTRSRGDIAGKRNRSTIQWRSKENSISSTRARHLFRESRGEGNADASGDPHVKRDPRGGTVVAPLPRGIGPAPARRSPTSQFRTVQGVGYKEANRHAPHCKDRLLLNRSVALRVRRRVT